MPIAPFALALVPTLVLLALVGAFRATGAKAVALRTAFVLGVVVTVPV